MNYKELVVFTRSSVFSINLLFSPLFFMFLFKFLRIHSYSSIFCCTFAGVFASIQYCNIKIL